ncbi:SDR family NAD(P)-dependent oxidoreductase [Altererythrobacter sp. C41]|uniref:SDR family NAD(P)-dependent oxidoreductase n=1 Tax=Altererythrobacter sp. C41 TaxID=2806021 RepID=UPI00193164F0|nr:SDR family NAD(P)-dependent oxidoreductase [Altererythrobacter sp. C41]MBM0171346.1 SDR family NAD(P)-dependent oxidoreductase [Altererythrobacter sp. C41]
MGKMFIFGIGYTGERIASALERRGWTVRGTGHGGTLAFDDFEGVRVALRDATHIFSSVPPTEEDDPVLACYGDALDGRWIGYLSSSGVYGDTGGAWVDESAPTGGGRRTARAHTDAAWLARGARVFRLPGIYGPGRSPLDRVREGNAHRIDLPGQVFCRVHVDDIVAGVLAALVSGDGAPPGAYNLADDLPASQNRVIEEACRLLGQTPPPLQSLDEAALSSPARAFYAENRRVANGKAKRVLGWRPRYPTYREGLVSLL